MNDIGTLADVLTLGRSDMTGIHADLQTSCRCTWVGGDKRARVLVVQAGGEALVAEPQQLHRRDALHECGHLRNPGLRRVTVSKLSPRYEMNSAQTLAAVSWSVSCGQPMHDDACAAL